MSDFFKEDKYWEKHINKELEEDLWIDNYLNYLPRRWKGLGTRILKEVIELHKNQDLHILYFKQNPADK